MSTKSTMSSFTEFFSLATGMAPFPFQCVFSGDGHNDWNADKGPPALVDIPTGLGKTAMAVLGWLWRRRFASDTVRRATPRRLVYCLPMRVLVEQTRDNANRWIAALKDAGLLTDEVPVSVLMGGEDPGESEWDIHPERDAIIIGTQDMLLSRALNRGYAASRARWPMHFGLLNTDCLWIFDEVQLMGSGLATTAQLEAFRRQLTPANGNGDNGPEDNGCRSVWMSATLRPDWLRTVDFKGRIDGQGRIDGKTTLSLSDAEKNNNDEIKRRWNAKKPLSRAESEIDDPAVLATEVRSAHKPGTRTIVVVNTVKRACALFDALSKAGPAAKAKGEGGKKKDKGAAASTASAATPAMPSAAPNLVLLHSRFRPPDRAKRVAEALTDVEPNGPGTIIVSTQVIEAGVDVSAATLFTELAPWASLVQRFGRCNRRGELNSVASVRWIDVPAKDADAEKVRHPYELADLRAAAEELGKLKDVGPGSLAAHRQGLSEKKQEALFPHRHTHVIRRKDLLDLFDTTPDLAGNDIDIDRYVREVEETDVRVFWRDWGDAKIPPFDTPQPVRREMCPTPAWGELGFREFAAGRGKGKVFRYDFLNEEWVPAGNDAAPITPGQVYMAHAKSGGYQSSTGWDPKSIEPVLPPVDEAPGTTPDWATFDADLREKKPPSDLAYDDDGLSMTGQFESITEHTDKVCKETREIVTILDDSEARMVAVAARWHDWGKAHEKFQIKIDDGEELTDKDADGKSQFRRNRDGNWASWAGRRDIAKAPGKRWNKQGICGDEGYWRDRGKAKDGFRKHFRHELASALAVLQRPHDSLKPLSDDDLNLIAYLIAAHHGKVRLSIRSMPNETRPRTDAGVPQKRFARGVWEGDVLGVKRDGSSEYEPVDLGADVLAPVITLSLEPMELGLCEGKPLECFRDQPSWIERVLRLRDRFGPFRLAYLEALLRAADERASATAVKPVEVNRA